MIELNTEEGYTLEIYDTSCIVSMYELYGGLKGEYTELNITGLSCGVVVLETKRQIESILRVKRELFKETKDDTNQMYKYTTEDEIVVATKGDKVTAIDQYGKEIDIAETFKVETALLRAGMIVKIEEKFFIKAIGWGRYWK